MQGQSEIFNGQAKVESLESALSWMVSGEVMGEKHFEKNKEEEQWGWRGIPRRAFSTQFKLVNILNRYGMKWTGEISLLNPEGSWKQIQKRHIQWKIIFEMKSDKTIHRACRSQMTSFWMTVLFQWSEITIRSEKRWTRPRSSFDSWDEKNSDSISDKTFFIIIKTSGKKSKACNFIEKHEKDQ